jgi:SAM-dependent methyltransferase
MVLTDERPGEQGVARCVVHSKKYTRTAAKLYFLLLNNALLLKSIVFSEFPPWLATVAYNATMPRVAKKKPRRCFDDAYYQRYYCNARTRVATPTEVARLGDFVCSYLKHLRQPVARALDIGCGLGRWQGVLRDHFPRAQYIGVEISDHACQRYGWQKGSVVDFRARTPFDLVICQGVLQYLSNRDASAAVQNLDALCRGALFLEALTSDDWTAVCDQRRTDGNVYLRSAAWYRRQLRPYFLNAGGGVFISRRAPIVLYALESC